MQQYLIMFRLSWKISHLLSYTFAQMIMQMTCRFYPSPPSLSTTVSPVHIDSLTAVTMIFKSGTPHDAFSSTCIYSSDFIEICPGVLWSSPLIQIQKNINFRKALRLMCFFSDHTHPGFPSCIWQMFQLSSLSLSSFGSLSYHNDFFVLPIFFVFLWSGSFGHYHQASQLGFTLCLRGD